MAGIHEDRCPACRPTATPPVVSAATGTQNATMSTALRPAPPGGGVLYVGMNEFKEEVTALNQHMSVYKANVTTITASETDKKFAAEDGKSYNLDTPEGRHDFCNGLPATCEAVHFCEKLLEDAAAEDRDELANVIQVYAKTENDGVDRMSRFVLSGHNFGEYIYDEHSKGAVHFDALRNLGSVFRAAAGQTRHIFLIACLTGDTGFILTKMQPAFPNMITYSGWTMMCPTGSTAAGALKMWLIETDLDPRVSLKPPEFGRSNWVNGHYQGKDLMDDTALLASLHSDDARYALYVSGDSVDPDSHAGWLLGYYARATAASQRPSITGADHTYAQKAADGSFRLRFWRGMVFHFWKMNKDTLETARIQDMSSMTRKQALAAADAFLASGGAGTAADLCKGLRDLDANVLPGLWSTAP